MITSGEKPSCAVCGAVSAGVVPPQPADYEYFVEPHRQFTVFQCAVCGSRFIHPRPTVAELVSFYPDHYHAYNEDHGGLAAALVAMRDRNRAKQYRRLTSSRPIRLFDVGTGDCRHFQALSRHAEFEFAGVEIKPEMVRAARDRGFNVHEGTLEDMDISGHQERYDLVTMYQLVEHVLDPRSLFAKAAALLKPGGWVLGQLPCMDSLERRLFGRHWAGYHFPRHLQMLTKRGMRALLIRTGFDEIAVPTALHLQAGLSLQNFLVGGLGYRPRLRHGKTPIYSLLLLAVAPFCAAEYICRQGGMMNFLARKPASSNRRLDETPEWPSHAGC